MVKDELLKTLYSSDSFAPAAAVKVFDQASVA